jgi:hypothetical protein
MKMKNLLLTALATLGLTAATMAQNVPSYVPTNGLVSWWPFNGNANDESGNGNNGTVNGGNLANDRFGSSSSALEFTSGPQIMCTNNQFLAPASFSIFLWFNTLSSQVTGTDGLGRIFGFDDGQCQHIFSQDRYLDMTSTGQIRFHVNHSSGNYFIYSLPGKNDGNWHSVACTFNSNGMNLYIDGILEATDSNDQIASYNGYWRAGGLNNTVNPSLIGFIDDIGIWNRGLTQQEISDLNNALNCASNTTITPQTNSLITGSTVIFTATTSDPNPSYVWQSDLGQGFQTLNNFGSYSGVNTTTLNIANAQLANHTQPIRVITTSGNCIDTSNVAVINILDTCITNVTVYDTLLTTVTDTLVINATITGLTPPNNLNTIKVFPNPANDHITIDYGNFASLNGYQLKIENSLGQQVFQTNVTQQSDYLSLTNWGGNGLYFIHIIDPQGNTIDIRKIVLQ